MSRWSKFCGWLLKKKGWTAVGGPVAEDKAVILGVPHTSFQDFVISYLFYTSLDAQKARVMIKKEFFFWPLGPLLRSMGAVPVDRKNATTLVKSLIEQMEKEWTRYRIALDGKDLTQIKTGFGFSLVSSGDPIAFYLDDIVYTED